VRYELEGDQERKQSSPPPAPAPEEQVGDRQRMASAVGNSAMTRAVSSGRAASLVGGAPMSVARAAAEPSRSELEDAPEELSMAHGEHAEAAPAHEAAHATEGPAEDAAPPSSGAAETAPESAAGLEEEQTKH